MQEEKMKNILIPTDFSDNSWNALRYATSFFKKEPCAFYLLHVSPYEVATSGITTHTLKNPLDDHKLSVKQQFKNLQKKIEHLIPNTKHKFFTLQEYVYLVDSIRKIVDEKSITYIVMGTRGASGLKEKTIGSNTGDVITKVKCPVLIIPEKATYVKPLEIAFPTDYNLHYKSKVLNTVTDVVSKNNSNLRVVHISKKEKKLSELQKGNKEFLHYYLDEKVAHSFHFLSNANIEDSVQCFVESRDIHMIMMIAKNINFFQRILFRPTVEKISYHTSIPFLVLHE